jgi:hypothetical protein
LTREAKLLRMVLVSPWRREYMGRNKGDEYGY